MPKDMYTIILFTIIISVGLISTVFLGDDNPIEQEAEKIIHQELDIDIDLSPEKNNDSNKKI